jgi:hypothetical protein
MASRPGYPLPLLRPAPGATLIVLKLEWLGASRRHWSMGTPPAWAAFMDQEEKDPSIFGGGGKPAQADPARSPDSRLRKHDRQWIIAIRSCTGRVGCASSGST